MSLFVGLFLLIPVMIMVLKPIKEAALVTTIVCMFVAGLILAIAANGTVNIKNIFAGVAAYVVVLVG